MEMSKVELSDFQKRFFAQGTGQTLFTEKEFSEALAQAKGEIMAIAIQTTKQAIFIEREACAELVMVKADEVEKRGMKELANALRDLANDMINRIPSQRQ
jgi:hypothetical protein